MICISVIGITKVVLAFFQACGTHLRFKRMLRSNDKGSDSEKVGFLKNKSGIRSGVPETDDIVTILAVSSISSISETFVRVSE